MLVKYDQRADAETDISRLRGRLGGRRLSPGDSHQCQQDAQHSRHVAIPLPRFF